MSDKEKDEIRGHAYDGIEEYDNDLPRWWVWLFGVTILVAIVYPFIYDFGPGEFASESIDAELAALNVYSQTLSAAAPEVAEGLLLKVATDISAIEEGKGLFQTRCLPCHGEFGQGGIGPNLTDDYWIHGAQIEDMQRVITDGVIEKGMLAWKTQLTGEQINAVTAYVWSLHGTDPLNAKAPQGNKIIRK